ncbi:MAG: RNA polymerase sigma factor [Bacteroidales bacterium]|nr:RNA polymerase sigma factor [Bacteroidales bacterium]MCF8388954.1 RNA polymerase sigma factor [Bacteroidales bacterium]MCF8397403.1 RNA polymerase sigma factor [Bacteroidales bacterium]
MTRAEYNQCVDDYADGVYRFILKNIKNEDKASDIVQDAFVKMWDKVETINSEKARSYLFTAAYHTMIDYVRKEKRMVDSDEDHSDILTSENQYNDLNDVLHEALEKLPEIQRSVVLLRDYEGYSYEEIGEITRLNESQVKVYIYRARRALKKYIGSLDRVL